MPGCVRERDAHSLSRIVRLVDNAVSPSKRAQVVNLPMLPECRVGLSRSRNEEWISTIRIWCRVERPSENLPAVVDRIGAPSVPTESAEVDDPSQFPESSS